MESPANRTGRQTSPIADARRSGPERKTRVAAWALEATDVVRHGMGRGSRIDLTIVSSGRRVRLTGLPAKHVLSYERIENYAFEEGMVLPYIRYGNRVWRRVLSPAMERARIEPSLEGEEIACAIAAEIRALLESCRRGESAFDLMAGKVVKQGDHLFVSPKTLVRAVRSRLVDDVLPQTTIAEAATTHLGMRQTRPRFADARPRAWAFPLPLAAAREGKEAPGLDESAFSKPVEEAPGEAHDAAERGAGTAETDGIRSMDRTVDLISPLSTEGCELDPVDRRKTKRHDRSPSTDGLLWALSHSAENGVRIERVDAKKTAVHVGVTPMSERSDERPPVFHDASRRRSDER